MIGDDQARSKVQADHVRGTGKHERVWAERAGSGSAMELVQD